MLIKLTSLYAPRTPLSMVNRIIKTVEVKLVHRTIWPLNQVPSTRTMFFEGLVCGASKLVFSSDKELIKLRVNILK